MSLSIGIVGLPNVGKSTLFQALTKKQVSRENYPFCTIDPNIGVVAVPDERVDKLVKLTNSAKKIYTTIEFFDIAGLVAGAHKGEGLGNKFLAHIRETDAIIYVLRGFQNEKITNTQNTINIFRDKEILDTEMALKDLETMAKIITRLKKDAKSGNKKTMVELKILEKVQAFLEKGSASQEMQDFLSEQKEFAILEQYQFLTFKPRLYLLNCREKEINQKIIQTLKKNNWHFLCMNILEELEISNLSLQERKEFNLPDVSSLNHLIKKSYKLLDLITFFTTGEDETRAWTLKRGQTAPSAGRVIHSDFEKQFIRAEVINWQDLYMVGGYSKAREKGLVRTEGKEYIVQDGDVIEIKI